MERPPKFTNQKRNQPSNAAANEKRRSKTSTMASIAISNTSRGDCHRNFATNLWDRPNYNLENPQRPKLNGIL